MERFLCAPHYDLEKAIKKRSRCMEKRFLMSILLVLSVGFISVNAKAATVATFADPSGNSDNPLFTVNFSDGPSMANGLTQHRFDSANPIQWLYC